MRKFAAALFAVFALLGVSACGAQGCDDYAVMADGCGDDDDD